MDSKIITPIELLKESIRNNTNLVLQGGAGSGKTETLKQYSAGLDHSGGLLSAVGVH